MTRENATVNSKQQRVWYQVCRSRQSGGWRSLGLVLGLGALGGCWVLSLLWGAADLSPATIWQALTAFDGSTEHLIIRTVRLPRSLLALVVGSALGVAGALMQGLTRNPMADPGILGISAGAALAVVLATFLQGSASPHLYAGVAFVGGAIAAVCVYALGTMGRKGLTPLKLILAGAVVSYLLSAVTTGILILSQRTLDEIRFWLAGSLAGRDLSLLLQVAPYVALGLAIALGLGRPLNALTLGDDVAAGLGLNTVWIKAIAILVVVLLAGSAVALAGPIGFVGLVVPHMVRAWVGVDYRWIIPYTAIWGAMLMALADVAARLVIRPQELPVGVMMALIGAPFFVYLARVTLKR